MPSAPDHDPEHDSDHNQGRLLLLIPKTSYRAQDFLAAAEQLGADVAVGSNHRSTLEKLSDGKTVRNTFNLSDKPAQNQRRINDGSIHPQLIGRVRTICGMFFVFTTKRAANVILFRVHSDSPMCHAVLAHWLYHKIIEYL